MSISEVLPIIRSQFSKLKICSAHDKVYKDECVLSYDSPYSDGGLYVNLTTLLGYGADYVQSDIAKGGVLYLHEKWTQVPKAAAPELEAEVTKLAIGVPGGFSSNSPFDVVKENTLIVAAPSGLTRIPLPCEQLPEFVSNVIQSVIKHEGMKLTLQAVTWDADSEKKESKYARALVQLNTGKKISQDKSSWRCEASGDTHNLWLNLSTGYIGGGRKNWDGSGGSGAAYQHYLDTGSLYPLCVKLGTITPHGADVWSYAADEDAIVTDPLLAEHLSHWGIDTMTMEKSEKSFTESEVELNMSYDWSKMMEGAEKLVPVTGPGFVGIHNIGSSCYMNSVLQMLIAVPEIRNRYMDYRAAILQTAPKDPAVDFGVQFSKLVEALVTGKYAPPLPPVPVDGVEPVPQPLEKYTIAPIMLKQLVGQGHPEFSSGRQQDASEYCMYLLQFLSRVERTLLPRIGAVGPPSSALFDFQTESRYELKSTRQVKYVTGKHTTANVIELRVPLQEAVNKEEVESVQERKKARVEQQDSSSEVASATGSAAAAGSAGAAAAAAAAAGSAGAAAEEEVKLVVPFEACLNTFFGDETVDFRDPSGRASEAVKTTRIKGFPKYLTVKLARYYIGPNWVQVKVDARIPVPEELDLGAYAGKGPQDWEDVIAEAASSTTADTTAAAAAVAVPTTSTVAVVDEEVLGQLLSMGFAENGCRKAAMLYRDVEEAMNWVLMHMEDPDFNDPPDLTATTATSVTTSGTTAVGGEETEAVREMVMLIESMGYTSEQARAALKATDNNIERAVDWIFSHSDDLDAAVLEVTVAAAADAAGAGSGEGGSSSSGDSSELVSSDNGRYSLFAVITHIGKNTNFGHYVCHLKKDGQWYLFNDEKVGQSNAQVALESGFMYFYRRND